MIAFVVAGFVFVGSVGAVLFATDDIDGPAVDDAPTAASLRLQAGSLLDLLLNSPGLHANPDHNTGDWDTPANVEWLQRLGLEDPDHPGYLDYNKFQNLRLAPLIENGDGDLIFGEADVDNDGFLNYVEATAAMGLSDAGLDFHIRSYPNLAAVRELLEGGNKDQNLRVAYIGDIEETNGASTGVTIDSLTCSATERPNAYRLTATVTIPANAGTNSLFEGVFDIDLGGQGNSQITRKMNSFVVGSAEATLAFHASVPFGPGRSCNSPDAEVEFALYDIMRGRLVDPREFDAAYLSSPTEGSSVAQDGLLVDTLEEFYTSGQTVSITYGGEGLSQGDDLFVMVCPAAVSAADCAAAPTTSESFDATSGNGNNPRELSLGTALPADEYIVRLYRNAAYSAAATTAEERLVVRSTADITEYVPLEAHPTSYTFGDAVQPEVGFLEDLVQNFCPTLFDEASARNPLLPAADWDEPAYADRCGAYKPIPDVPTAGCAAPPSQPGDVFAQARNTLKADLKARLLCNPSNNNCDPDTEQCGRYDITNTLVIGSNVDHQMLTSNQVKDTIALWVEEGGTLIVFGSADQRLEWLQSVFFIATSDTSSNGIAVPDSSHPVLHTGDDLAYNEYDHHGQTWSFKENGANADIEAYFTHVVLGDNGDPVLTISDPGAFGSGTVILTTWLPYDIMGDGPPSDPDCAPPSPDQGCLLMNNLLMQGYRDLFLDYGPVIPESDHDVIPAVRKAQICYPPFDPDYDPAVPATNDCPPEARIPLDVIVYVF